MKELAIGEEIHIRCVEDKGGNICGKCAFTDICDSDYYGCSWKRRSDNKNVHFELVENPEPIELPTDEEISAYSSMYFTGSAVHYVREGMRIMKKMVEEMLNQKEKDNESK